MNNDGGGKQESEVITETQNAIADDAIRLFRAGLFLIVIYVTILSLTLREGGVRLVSVIIASTYTRVGIVLWIGSVSTALITHRSARRVALKETHSELGRVSDEMIIMNLNSGTSVSLLLSVFSLLFGLFDGWQNIILDSNKGLPITTPIIIVLFSISIVASISGILGIVEYIRERWGPIRELLCLS